MELMEDSVVERALPLDLCSLWAVAISCFPSNQSKKIVFNSSRVSWSGCITIQKRSAVCWISLGAFVVQ